MNLNVISKALNLEAPIQASEEKVRMYSGKVKEDDLEKIDLFETSEERKLYGKVPDLTKQVPLYILGLEKNKNQ